MRPPANVRIPFKTQNLNSLKGIETGFNENVRGQKINRTQNLNSLKGIETRHNPVQHIILPVRTQNLNSLKGIETFRQTGGNIG